MTESSSDSALLRGARRFDDGAFFEAHEAWEVRWLAAEDATERRFLQGLIQVAAAFHKLFVTRDAASASRLLARGLAKLDACPDVHDGLDLAALRVELHACTARVAADELDRAAVPRMLPRLSPPAQSS